MIFEKVGNLMQAKTQVKFGEKYGTKGLKVDRLPARILNDICLISDGYSVEYIQTSVIREDI